MEPRDRNGMTEAEFLAAYEQKNYPKPALTADIVVFSQRDASALELLLIRRGGHPFLNTWALPGGFVGPEEDADEAAARELGEETGLARIPLEQLGFYSTPGRDPRGWTVSAAYLACVEGARAAKAADDAADAQWFAIAVEGRGTAHTLVMTRGSERLHIAFEECCQAFSAPRARVENSSGLAFDHARIVADAYLRVADAL
jgi:8-oxo-dGTP diphosphatase